MTGRRFIVLPMPQLYHARPRRWRDSALDPTVRDKLFCTAVDCILKVVARI